MSLPSGYKRLEYIESTGTQYIDTGFVTTLNTKVEFKISSSSAQLNTYPQLFGVQQKSDGTNRFGITSDWTAKTGSTGMAASTVVRDIPREGSLEYNKYVLDGVTYTATGSWTLTNASLYLFSNNSADGLYDGKVTLRSVAKFYYFKMYDSGTLVRDFVPAKRNSDSVVGLYDLVTNSFFTNAGTGKFVAGPYAVPEMPERLTASVNGSFVTLTWSASNDSTGYKISRNGVQIADQTALSFTDTVDQGQTYVYTVVAYNGNGDSEPAKLTVQTPPGAPTTLYQTMAVRLSWSSVSSAERYNIYRNGKLLGTTTGLFYVDDTAAENTEYTYSVSAVNSAGESSKTTITVYTKSGYFLYKPYIESATFQ